jgi:Fic family protein
MRLVEQIAESLRIEGIHRPPTTSEIAAHKDFLRLPAVTVADLESFVSVYQPGHKLRDKVGSDVRIGNYYPPPGGPQIRPALEHFLERVNQHHALRDPFMLHAEYEMLHPFTDGNGRSGRVLWYWMMEGSSGTRGLATLGFLHAWYYQTLRHLQTAKE